MPDFMTSLQTLHSLHSETLTGDKTHGTLDLEVLYVLYELYES